MAHMGITKKTVYFALALLLSVGFTTSAAQAHKRSWSDGRAGGYSASRCETAFRPVRYGQVTVFVDIGKVCLDHRGNWIFMGSRRADLRGRLYIRTHGRYHPVRVRDSTYASRGYDDRDRGRGDRRTGPEYERHHHRPHHR